MARELFTDRQKEAIQLAIQKAELDTSGEIRVRIEKFCNDDPVKRAVEVFEMLGMHETELRNGVLIYLAMDNKKLAIIGDKGINDVVPAHFWDDEKELMRSFFANGQFSEGLVRGIVKVGEQLKTFFPYQESDKDELSNEISFED